MSKKIENLVDKHCDWIIRQRREIHRYPEASTQEIKTAKKVKDILSNLGFNVEEYYHTGVAGIIEGANAGKTVALRFDMDALEMEEKTDLPFASEVPGIMHACGHDGHTAMGLGVARVLSEIRDEFNGKVKLIFQPAEEDAPNGGGAQYMIKEGVLKSPDVNGIIGMHIWPNLEYGKVSTKTGPIMAASDPFVIKVAGKGVHASQPYLGIDPIVVGSEIVSNLQTIVSRNIASYEQAVISIGVFQGGTRYNTIPDMAVLKGTVRTFNQNLREKIHDKIKSIAEKTAEGMGAKAELEYTFGYPPLVNEANMVKIAEKSINEILGKDNFVLAENPAPTGEDFAYFAREIPAVFLWLGSGKKDMNAKLHSPYFNFDESILATGTKVMVNTALHFLNEVNN